MLRAFLLVGLGGGAGSMARYGIGIALGKFITHPYPFATFLINIIGCFIIGILFGLTQKLQVTQADWWLILATGFCGGFTTFSAFALENIQLMRNGYNMGWLIYTAASVILGLLLCRLGISLIK